MEEIKKYLRNNWYIIYVLSILSLFIGILALDNGAGPMAQDLKDRFANMYAILVGVPLLGYIAVKQLITTTKTKNINTSGSKESIGFIRVRRRIT